MTQKEPEFPFCQDTYKHLMDARTQDEDESRDERIGDWMSDRLSTLIAT